MEDKTHWWLILIVSFLGGGVISAIITSLFNNHQININKKKDFLEQQLQKLYGPLYWLVSQTDKLFDLNNKIMKAYDGEYCDSNKKYSQEKQTQDALNQETSITINVANEYIAKVEENNKQMLVVLNDNYSYIDTDDIDFFQLFYEHKVRNEIEYGQDNKLKLPTSIYCKVGNVSFLKPEIIKRIKSKFLEKKGKLERGKF